MVMRWKYGQEARPCFYPCRLQVGYMTKTHPKMFHKGHGQEHIIIVVTKLYVLVVIVALVKLDVQVAIVMLAKLDEHVCHSCISAI